MPSPSPPDEALQTLATMVGQRDPESTIHARDARAGHPPRPAPPLTGSPRHAGESLYDVLFSARYSPPFTYGPDVPAELAALLNRAMDVDPEARFPTALALRQALAAFRRHRGSIALADEAAARLVAARARGEPGGAVDDRRTHALLTECRFGFTQALRAWPENAAAQAGLEECLVLMLEHEIGQRDLEGARALYAELRAPRPDLAARVEALAADLAAATEREARLRALELDRDLSIGGGAQLAVLGLLPLIAIGAAAYLLSRGGGAIRPAEVVGAPAVALVGLLAVLAAVRRRLHTEISRRALTLLMLLPAAGVAHRVLGLVLGAPIPALLMGDLIISLTVLAALAVSVSPRLGWAGVPVVVGAFAITLSPDHAIPIFGATLLVGFAVLLGAWRRAMRS